MQFLSRPVRVACRRSIAFFASACFAALAVGCGDGAQLPSQSAPQLPSQSVSSTTSSVNLPDAAAAPGNENSPVNESSSTVAKTVDGQSDVENAHAVAASAGKAPEKVDPTKFDPIRANGEIFQDWPKPQLALVISGEQLGYLEPCGCAGLETMKGGLGRRATLLKDLRQSGWPVVAVDLGSQVRRSGKQAEIQFHTTVDAFRAMQYDAVAVGAADLGLPTDDLLADLSEPKNHFVSANVAISDGVPARFLVVQRGGKKIGITSVLSKSYQDKVKNQDVLMTDPAAAVAEVLKELRGKCDFVVLLSHGSLDESKELAARFPAIDVIVSAGGATPPPAEPTTFEGNQAWMVEVGNKGMHVGVVAWFNDQSQPRRFQRVPIDSRFKDAPEIYRLRVAMQDQFREATWTGLGLTPAPIGGRDATFVGSEKCGECHTKAFAIWDQTPHAHATKTLVDLDPPRQFDPECVSCHVTGWEPQRYTPLKSGFLSLEKTPHLAGNGCENCHGPGSKHVAAESGEKKVAMAEQLKLRAEMRLMLKEAHEKSCVQCHDLDNSPDYVHDVDGLTGFERYWPQVEHKGKD